MGSSLSVSGESNFGDNLSVRGSIRLGGYNKIANGANSDNTYARFQDTEIDFTVAATRKLSMTQTQGSLHGVWVADTAVTASDRRLKTSIEPLQRTLAAHHRKQHGGSEQRSGGGLLRRGSAQSEEGRARSAHESPVGWLLRELRPVSFHLKKGAEAKYLKFGFIAQEVENVFPNLVHTGQDEMKAIAMQDLIAVLTLALQTLQSQMEENTVRVRNEQKDLSERMERMERILLSAFPPQQAAQAAAAV